ncbi:MAG: T9SS type A sorting domain-containing protein [Planctomycetes bacterium]|nr:T9SS type A sorting domain-containing protein [Planctomycetota bacterium]
MHIYPNPAHGQATIALTLPPSVAHLPLPLSVVGMDGRIAQQRSLDGNGAHTLALEGLAAGVYHVHVTSKGKWLTEGKLIVQ